MEVLINKSPSKNFVSIVRLPLYVKKVETEHVYFWFDIREHVGGHHLGFVHSFNDRLPCVGGARDHKPKLEVPVCMWNQNTRACMQDSARMHETKQEDWISELISLITDTPLE